MWLVLVRALTKEHSLPTSAAFVDAGRAWLAKETLLRHYSRERITSVEARARFVEPDIEPLAI